MTAVDVVEPMVGDLGFGMAVFIGSLLIIVGVYVAEEATYRWRQRRRRDRDGTA